MPNVTQSPWKISLAWTLLLLLGFSSMFAMSGHAGQIGYSEAMTVVFCFIIPLYYLVNRKARVGNAVLFTIYMLVVAVELYWVCYHYRDVKQLTNVITLFGVVFFCDLFSNIPYRHINYYRLGWAMSILALVCIFLLLPGRIFSGWSSNSASCLVPALFVGGGFLISSRHPRAMLAFCLTQVTGLVLTYHLENRAAFLTVLLFFGLVITRMYLKKWVCVLLGSGLLMMNAALPVYHGMLSEGYIFREMNRIMETYFAKTALNGREELWTDAMERVVEEPWLGYYGIRGVYYHNFSLDALLQFGVLGWAAWVIIVIHMICRKTSEQYLSNVFVAGFGSLMFLNTFENALVANSAFLVLPYLLLAIPPVKKPLPYVNH